MRKRISGFRTLSSGGRAPALLALAAALAIAASLPAAAAVPAKAAGASAAPAVVAPAPSPAATAPAAEEALPEALRGRPRVLEVRFEGAPDAGLRALVPIADGAPLDSRDVRDAVRALHSSARFSQVAAWAEPVAKEQAPADWPSAVRVIFVLVPVKKLAEVAFKGFQALPLSILVRTINLQVNAEFQPDAVIRSVEEIKAAYHRVGHRLAKVTPVQQEIDDGIHLTFQIDEGRATRIAEVVFTGDLGLPVDELRAAFKLGEGDVLNLGLLDEGVKGVRDRYRQAGRLRAKVDAPLVTELDPEQARVTVPVEAGPPVRFHVRGNRSFPDGLLESKLAIEGDEPLDAQASQDLAQRLRRFYVQAGFFQVKVAVREVRARDQAVELVFSVEEGPQVRVEELAFQGNQGLPTAQLRERVLQQLTDAIGTDPAIGADPGEVGRRGVMGRLRGGPPDRTKVDPATVYDPVLYGRALKQIEDLYKSQGYLSAQAGPARVLPLGPDQGEPAAARPGARAAERAMEAARQQRFPLPLLRMRVEIPIREGDRSIVSQIRILGGSEVVPGDEASQKAFRDELDALVPFRPGAPFSYQAAEDGRVGITAAFTKRGYFYAKVEDEEVSTPGDEPGTLKVEVRYRVQAGPVVHVAFVEVVGQRSTKEELILDLIGLKPGDVLTPEGIDRGQQALLRTGLFFSATLGPRNPEVVEAEKTLRVDVRERPRRELQASFGFSLEDGPRASLQWTQANLFGRNVTFLAIGRANFPFLRYRNPDPDPNCASRPNGCQEVWVIPSDPVERLVDLGLSTQRLYPLDFLQGSVDLIHQRDVRPTYKLTKYSSQLSVALNRPRPFGARIEYEIGYQTLQKGQLSVEQILAGQDQRVFSQPEGDLVFHSIRPSLTLDERDDVARPRAGFFLKAKGDLFKSLTLNSIDVKLIKLEGLAAGYIPLPAMASVVVSVRGGRVYKLDGDDGLSVVPGDRRFYLGGAETLRGFHQDALQPQDVRNELSQQIARCNATLTAINHCDDTLTVLQAGAVSNGGLLMFAVSAELRIPVGSSLELALFYDGGNLWRGRDPNVATSVALPTNPFAGPLRGAVGSGMRYLTPIGRMAVDLGVNLDPDADLGEPRVGLYFSIDSL